LSVSLAATWRPRGELNRLLRSLPQLKRAYAGIALALPPDVHPDDMRELEGIEGVNLALTSDWSWGRHVALQSALVFESTHLHYADIDRLLRWVEIEPQEWQQILDRIEDCDCLIIGRSGRAYRTHPQALIQTEVVSNRVVSYFLGQEADVSAGSKGFSRRAVEFLLANCTPGHALGTDAEWTILLHRAGYRIETVEVDGLDWESADRYREQAADAENQKLQANLYDADPLNWSRRVEVADEIVRLAIETSQRHIQAPTQMLEKDESLATQAHLFDFEAVFDVDDYLYFYGDTLTDELSDQQVQHLVRELELEVPMKILDLACGFGRHANRLAALGYEVTGIDVTPGFLRLAQEDAAKKGVTVRYIHGDMRKLSFREEFDRVLLLFTAFGYFEDEENLLVLRKIYRALKPSGYLFFDIHNRDFFIPAIRPSIVTEKEGNLMIDRSTFDSLSGRLYNQRLVIRDGVRRDKPFFVRLYNPTEIRDLLGQAGFEIYRLYGGWDGSPISTESRRMVIIARKP